MYDADLSKANLSKANINGTNLEDANIRGATDLALGKTTHIGEHAFNVSSFG